MQDLPSEADAHIVSLLHIMLAYSIKDLVLMITALLRSSDALTVAGDRSAPPGKELAQKLRVGLEGLHLLGQKIELDSSLINEVKKLETECEKLSALVVETRLDTILNGVQENLGSRQFMYVPKDQAEYWNNAELFGDDFLIGFPAPALGEMIEAGNCYACGRWTACVFHSMRIAEYGLRSLAKRLKVSLLDKKKPQPIDYATWEKVITAIRGKITETRALSAGPRKEKKLQFYSQAADHCDYMKDIWRNEISHSRRRYNKAESLAVLNRVKEFVQPLAITDAERAVSKRIRLKQIEEKRKGLSHYMGIRSILGTPSPPDYEAVGREAMGRAFKDEMAPSPFKGPPSKSKEGTE